MSAGTMVFARVSLRRAGTWPVPFGRPFAMAGWVSGAFSLRGCPLACGALPPCGAGLGAAGFVASAFAMALAPVDRLVAPTAGANLAAVGENLDAGTRGLVAARADDEHVGESQRPSRSVKPPWRRLCVAPRRFLVPLTCSPTPP